MVAHLLLFLHSNPYSIKKTAEVDKSSLVNTKVRFFICDMNRGLI